MMTMKDVYALNMAYLVVSGEAATMPKVLKEIERIRREGSDFATVAWVARMFANTY